MHSTLHLKVAAYSVMWGGGCTNDGHCTRACIGDVCGIGGYSFTRHRYQTYCQGVISHLPNEVMLIPGCPSPAHISLTAAGVTPALLHSAISSSAAVATAFLSWCSYQLSHPDTHLRKFIGGAPPFTHNNTCKVDSLWMLWSLRVLPSSNCSPPKIILYLRKSGH